MSALQFPGTIAIYMIFLLEIPIAIFMIEGCARRQYAGTLRQFLRYAGTEFISGPILYLSILLAIFLGVSAKRVGCVEPICRYHAVFCFRLPPPAPIFSKRNRSKTTKPPEEQNMQLFTDREQGPKARTETVVDRRVERALAAVVHGFYSRDAFGIDFPSTCPDGAGCDGTDIYTFEGALLGAVSEMDGWMKRAVSPSANEEPLASTGAILDTLEWLYVHVGKPVKGFWHKGFQHHHLSWDRDEGRKDFREEINAVFSRNGLAYEMGSDGRVQRIVEGPDAELLARVRFETGDRSLDELLETARRRFFDRDQDAGQRAIEALWDGFERLKTLEDPANKKKSVESMISMVAQSEPAKQMINLEMQALTVIGNTWRIRHHEVGKTELGDGTHMRDYLFCGCSAWFDFFSVHAGCLCNRETRMVSDWKYVGM